MSLLAAMMGVIAGQSQPSYTYAVWDSAKKGANVTLSGGDLTATTSAGAGVVLTDIGFDIATADFYVEITINDNTNRSFVGVGKSTIDLTAQLGFDADGYSYVDTGSKRNNNSDSGYGSAWAAPVVLGIHVHSGTVTFYEDGVSQGDAFTGLTGTFYIGWSCNLVGNCTLNAGASAFAYSVPGGAQSGLYT